MDCSQDEQQPRSRNGIVFEGAADTVDPIGLLWPCSDILR